jgi:ABC-type polysaccharide/polyol phosphate export permease
MKGAFNWRYYLDFVFLLTKKEIKARYKRTLLGFLWVILNPFLQMLIIGLIFQFFVPMKIENYFLFLFAGLLPWNFFSTSLLRATPLIVQERSLIQKAAFPRELMVVSAVLANLFHTLVASLVFLLFLSFLKTSLIVGIFFFFSSLFLVCLLFVFLLFFTLATCLIVAALYVKIRDLIFIVQLSVQLLFYSVPVIYSLDMLPELFRKLLYFNPLVGFIEFFRFIVLGTVANFESLTLICCFSVTYLILAFIFFRKESKNFDDWF